MELLREQWEACIDLSWSSSASEGIPLEDWWPKHRDACKLGPWKVLSTGAPGQVLSTGAPCQNTWQ
eukprot:10301954-Lingulodinium_polyedra.AAC.1